MSALLPVLAVALLLAGTLGNLFVVVIGIRRERRRRAQDLAAELTARALPILP